MKDIDMSQEKVKNIDLSKGAMRTCSPAVQLYSRSWSEVCREYSGKSGGLHPGGHGVHSVSSYRPGALGNPDDRRLPGRGWLSAQLRGRAIPRALRAREDGARSA